MICLLETNFYYSNLSIVDIFCFDSQWIVNDEDQSKMFVNF